MINCNPETVSTDYDTSDRLYFEPLTAEDVIEIVRVEQRRGTLLGRHRAVWRANPAQARQGAGAAEIPILGTSPDAIDLAEDRQRFQQLLHGLGLRQPDNGTAYSPEEAEAIAQRIGYPVVIRPSYVLGGRAMEIVHDDAGLQRYIRNAVKVSGHQPGADRPLSAGRDRGRCRRRRRRRRRLRRRHHGAYRGSRHPFRRQRLLAAALQSRCRERSPRSSGRPSRSPARSTSSG